ncbi:TolB family protein [Candidatus Neomarinimicrobiota bacterium]
MQSCDENPANSKPLHENNRIVFISDRDYHNQVYLMEMDGSNQTRLTNDRREYFYPRFSPDGTQIIFYSGVKFIPYGGRTDNDDVYSINPDGTSFVSLTDSPGNDNNPQFSPDGMCIVFMSDRDGNREIYIMNADGSNQTRLTNNSNEDYLPRFSHNGSTIIYLSSNPSGYIAICTIGIDGSNLTNLTGDTTYYLNQYFPSEYGPGSIDSGPVPSPDGSLISFVSEIPGQGIDLFTMTSIGTEQTNLTPFGGLSMGPVFNPSGTKIAFRSFPSINNDIFVMNVDGSGLTNLTPNSGHVTLMGQYSPGGSKILYVDLQADQGNVFKIFTMDSDGANKTQLTTGHYNDLYPQFEPISAVVPQ